MRISSFYLREWIIQRFIRGKREVSHDRLRANLRQSLNDRDHSRQLRGRGLAWSMISACQYSVQQNADDPVGRVASGPGVQIPAAAPFTMPNYGARRVFERRSRDIY